MTSVMTDDVRFIGGISNTGVQQSIIIYIAQLHSIVLFYINKYLCVCFALFKVCTQVRFIRDQYQVAILDSEQIR